MAHDLPPQENPLCDGTPPESQFWSLGTICGMLQRPPSFVLKLAAMAEVEPSYSLDGVPLFRGDHLQRMAAVLQDERNRIEAAGTN